MKEVSKEFILKVLHLVARIDYTNCIWWRTDDSTKFGGKTDYSPVTFFVNCNDLFYWACADAEELTPENIDEFEKAINDIENMYETKRDSYIARIDAPVLFCARQRKMRPQGPYYKSFPLELWHLFDACGPERKVDAMNGPKPTLEEMKEKSCKT